eukprot:TRINITY_DN927_c4_g1_i1.p1 TRINITY_DN927_c4_g1~~TRINITY_DN927_c4_g1_i1.p1  ORF type:complete len:196 (-),score=39.00 TRINITY_DN927_c4_g1_i1:46-633(-)
MDEVSPLSLASENLDIISEFPEYLSKLKRKMQENQNSIEKLYNHSLELNETIEKEKDLNKNKDLEIIKYKNKITSLRDKIQKEKYEQSRLQIENQELCHDLIEYQKAFTKTKELLIDNYNTSINMNKNKINQIEKELENEKKKNTELQNENLILKQKVFQLLKISTELIQSQTEMDLENNDIQDMIISENNDDTK